MDEMTGSPNPLNKQQKVGFLFLLVFGMLAVGLGVLQMRNNIYGPFAYKEPAVAAKTDNDLLQSETVRLQSIDTDQDGLNDYEELYFYQTSPYLPDSDSDGTPDKQELDGGSDPLCPQGENCDTAAQLTPENATGTPQTGFSPFPQTAEEILGQVNTSIEQGQDTDLGALLGDVDSIRELIAQTGKIPREQLSTIDDQTLLNLVIEIMAEEGATSSTVNSSVSSTVGAEDFSIE